MFKNTDTVIRLLRITREDKCVCWLRIDLNKNSITIRVPDYYFNRLKTIDCRARLLSNAPKRMITLLKKLAKPEFVTEWAQKALTDKDDSENYRDLLNVL